VGFQTDNAPFRHSAWKNPTSQGLYRIAMHEDNHHLVAGGLGGFDFPNAGLFAAKVAVKDKLRVGELRVS
jgi:hypothetical protein